jgi:hypothetical protein
MLQWHPRLIALLVFAVAIAAALGDLSLVPWSLRGWGWL